MKHYHIKTFIYVFLCVSFSSISAHADTVQIQLDNVQITECNQIWADSGAQLSLVNTTEQDCGSGGSCSFGIESDGIWLWPSRLSIDISNIGFDPVRIEIDVTDFCGIGCTRAFLYNGNDTVIQTSNTVVAGKSTFVLDGHTLPVDSIAVSSCEGFISEIRIFSSNNITMPWLPLLLLD